MVDALVPPGVALTIGFLWAALSGCYMGFMFACTMLSIVKLFGAPPDNFFRLTANNMWHLTRWPCLVFFPCDPIFQLLINGHLNWVTVGFTDCLGGFLWWFYRNLGDDDRWKDLKNWAGKKIAVIRRKLVVVPAQPEAA